MSRWLTVLAVLVVLGIVALVAFAPLLKSQIRSRTEAYLRARFQSDVQFAKFDIHLYPLPRITIDSLTLRLKGRTDVPPLIEIQHVSFSASLLDLLRRRYTIENVQLDGLQIHIPPKGSGARPRIQGTDVDLAKMYPILIKAIHADNGLISILRDDPKKPSRDFPIHQLLVTNFSFDDPATFHARLTNPIPGEKSIARAILAPGKPTNRAVRPSTRNSHSTTPIWAPSRDSPGRSLQPVDLGARLIF